MKSTGEVMGVGKTFGEAFVKSQLGAGTKLPLPKDAEGKPTGKVFLTVKNSDKPRTVEVARQLHEMGFPLIATKGTSAAITAAGIPCETVNTVEERRNAIADSRAIRTSSLLARVTTFTTIAGAEAAVEGMRAMENLDVISVQEMHAQLA
jgi:carbamoyl-phosphate synthase large subunit